MIKHKRRLIIFLISGILLFYILQGINITNLSLLLKNANYLFLMSVIPLVIAIFFIKVARLNLILKIVGINIRFSELSKIFLIGSTYGLITPGRVGEFGRVYYFNEDKSKTFPSLIVERLADIFILVMLSNITLFLLFRDISLIFISFAASLFLLIFTFILINKKVAYFVLTIFKVSKDKRNEYMENLLEILKRKHLSKILMLTLLNFTISFIVAFVILKSLDFSANYLLIFSLPIIILFSNIPITISGTGLREFITVYSFTQLGAVPELGFSFSLILFLTTILLPGLIGFFLILRK